MAVPNSITKSKKQKKNRLIETQDDLLKDRLCQKTL